MELIEVILSKENLNRAYKKVVANKGASGVDGVTVEELGDYIRKNREKIVTSLRNRTYIPKPVRRVYIPKDNGKKRPLGIPTALDRTIQQAIARPLVVTIKRVNEIVRGWINYFRIGLMKQFVEELGQWLRHKIRMIVMKQWKKPKTIYRNLSYLNWKNRNGYSQEDIHKVANSRLGWYRRSGMNVVNFIISKDLLENRIKDGAGLLNPLSYYLAKVGI